MSDYKRTFVPGSNKPQIDVAENNDQQYKIYMSKSMKHTIKAFARREGMTDSEAGRALMLRAFNDPGVFGGYDLINSLARN